MHALATDGLLSRGGASMPAEPDPREVEELLPRLLIEALLEGRAALGGVRRVASLVLEGGLELTTGRLKVRPNLADEIELAVARDE